MKRIGIITTLSTLLMALFVALLAPAALAVQTTTINPANAPEGTHLQRGTIGCTVNDTTLLVTCSTFELAGVGNTNATGSLVTSYSATVTCTNNGGKTVPVKSTVQTAPTTTGSLSPENGRLSVPSLSSSPVPTAADFEASATCPNPNWKKKADLSTLTLESFTYTLTFAGFSGAYITVTGP
jgi:hypothetical protein